MKRLCTFLMLLCGASVLNAQFTVASGTSLAAADGTDIVMKVKGNVSNGSTYDFANASLQLHLLANTAAQSISGNLSVTSLNLFSGQNTTLNGNLTVRNEIYFNSGLLTPAAGKILFTGSADDLNGDEGGTFDDSYVNGAFFVKASGVNKFPVGSSATGYAPARIENGNGDEEIAVAVVGDNAGMLFDPSGSIAEIDQSRYWMITAANLAALDAKISLSLDGVIFTNPDLSPVVVQASAVNSNAENILGLVNEPFLSSRKSVTQPVVAIGGSREVELIIHNIITPFSLGENDYLVIDNIDKFLVNKVTLLDRWGGKVKEWKNFTNYNDPVSPNQDGYDFTRLSPGNYICIVEYGDNDTGFSTKSQMVTVLKAK